MAANVKAKISLQLSLKIKKIDSRCSKSYRPAKKDKNEVNSDYRDKNKSIQNISLINISQLYAQTSKKNKYHQKNY